MAHALGGKADENGFMHVYITHVFEIAPSSQSAWDSLKELIGKISNSANSKDANGGKAHYLTANAYDNGNDSLSWYRTIDEFVKPGGDSTFWSNGNANPNMYACVNILLKFKENISFRKAKVSVFYYDENDPQSTIISERDSFEIENGEEKVYKNSDIVKEDGKPYIEKNGKKYIINEDGVKAYLIKNKDEDWTGDYTVDKARGKVKKKYLNVDLKDSSNITFTNGYAKAEKFAIYIPVSVDEGDIPSGDPNDDVSNDTPDPTSSEAPSVPGEDEPSDGPADGPAEEPAEVKVSIVYYDAASDEKSLIKTVAAPKGKVGDKKYTANLDVSSIEGGYYVDKDGEVLAVYGSKRAVQTKYDTAKTASRYQLSSFTEKKVVIKDALKDAKYTAIWVPVKTGPKVTVHYIDEDEKDIAEDDGGVTRKGDPFVYKVDPSKVSDSYEMHPEKSYISDGTNVQPAGVLDDEIRIDPFPYDKPTDLFIPCEKITTELSTGTYFSWNAMEPGASATILSDDYDVTTAIPSSENVYSKTSAAAYLSQGNLGVHTGDKSYTISVQQYATRSWYIEGDPIFGDPYHPDRITGHEPDEPTGDSGYVTSSVTVTLPWTYYTVDDYVLYNLIQALISSGALDESFDIATSNEALTISSTHYEDETEHVKDPAGYTAGMTVTISGTLSSSSTGYSAPDWPSISTESAEAAVKSALGAVQVRNDEFTFGETTVMDDDWVGEDTEHEPDTSTLTTAAAVEDTAAAKTIPAARRNIRYTSSGQFKYQLAGSYNTTAADTYTATVTVNEVKVHTPIVCKVTIDSDNLKYVQAPTVDGTACQLVVGRSDSLGVSNTAANNPNMTSDFSVQFSNNGQHRDILGYGSRNYSRYLLRNGDESGNMVRFAFDCIADIGIDYDESNDRLVRADTWYALPTGTTKMRFYLPEWVAEGTYGMEFKSVALNGNASSQDEDTANLSTTAYAASVDDENAQVTSKMYNFTVFDIASTAEWSDVFKTGSVLKYNNLTKYADGTTLADFDKNRAYYYTAGTKNELGINTGRLAKYGLPLIAGSNPKYKNMGLLKAGYVWRFKLDTVSAAMQNDSASIKIVPSFYWVDENGQNREEVDLYYNETWGGKKHTIVRIGGSTDATNVKTDYAGNADWGINPDELKTTASIRGMNLNTWSSTKATVYTYDGITSNILFKTFSNSSYASKISGYGLNGTKTTNDLTKLKQTWYFEYSLPEFHAVSKGYDVDGYIRSTGSLNYKESFWKKDGYVIVHFDIEAYDKNGIKIMTYATPNNDMWTMEGFLTSRTDANSKALSFEAGDVFMVYADPSKMLSSDYSGDHLN
ncbi:MAG: DUF5704 domain-containing protein [Lachnospiraceae bacterium]|nr:DUF5704 domain-containing protein [Lachnospiraceae bacterium]